MHERFLLYIRTKGLTQKRLSELSGVSTSMISRFCAGSPISSDKLVSLLHVCDDLSLDWLFFSCGAMLREASFGSGMGKDAAGDDGYFSSLIAEKDRIIAQKDRVIQERDETIRRLYERLLELGKA